MLTVIEINEPRSMPDFSYLYPPAEPVWFNYTPVVRAIELMLHEQYSARYLIMTALTSRLQLEQLL
jgi:hypothetical protein